MNNILFLTFIFFLGIHGPVFCGEPAKTVEQPELIDPLSREAKDLNPSGSQGLDFENYPWPPEKFQSVLRDLRNPFESFLPKEVQQPIKVLDSKEMQKTNQDSLTASRTRQMQASQDIVLPPSVTVSGYIWNSERPQAIVNNLIVDIGDVVDQWNIKNISSEGVLVEFEGTTELIKP